MYTEADCTHNIEGHHGVTVVGYGTLSGVKYWVSRQLGIIENWKLHRFSVIISVCISDYPQLVWRWLGCCRLHPLPERHQLMWS